ncbi:FAD-dependent monooxygenase terD [Lachnellula suecica]|uniref:FAD-dependent monooxygenase terD n=1 Tax=Lachnellula suecica TaxID=602035 RepID=A0A8T9CJ34_9HELO|nr:FAD-dependent monooxygenase terD [Lachnellula suecica]
MPEQVDVFICGSGSAGLLTATWLARCGLRCKIVDSRVGPLEKGQADGVQCRTVEVFESFGLVDGLLREGCHVIENAFWFPDGKGGIAKTRTAAATAPGLSHQPRLILNQARVNGILLEDMKKSNGQVVDYGCKVLGVKVDREQANNPDAYPVKVTIEKDGKEEIWEAKYALGADGAHSAVRKSLGYKMIGDPSDTVWGVMDVFPQTNFPDIRKHVMMISEVGAIVIVPREGDKMSRLYIELPPGTVAKDVKLEHLQAAAKQIFRPYNVDFAGCYWWSAYSIGQRLADYFSKDNRVFLTGDACHTHSPKAGQGMNVSLQDGYNIGWKLASVLKGQTGPELLKTYNIDREKVAADLIKFDKIWVKRMSSKNSTEEMDGVDGAFNDIFVPGLKDFSEIFVRSGKFTAGLTLTYEDSPITNAKGSNQELAKNLIVGMRVPSKQVVRFCDAKALQFVNALKADGRWRIVVFTGDIRQETASKRLSQLGEYLFSDAGPIRQRVAPGADIDSFIEVILVLSGDRVKTEQELIPECFLPVTGKWQMRDIHKTYVDDESYHSGHGHAYDFYGIDPEKGALAIVRPDQHVSMVLDINDHGKIGDFFDGFANKRS